MGRMHVRPKNIKTRSYASFLVSEGPLGTYGVLACEKTAFKLGEVPKTWRDAA